MRAKAYVGLPLLAASSQEDVSRWTDPAGPPVRGPPRGAWEVAMRSTRTLLVTLTAGGMLVGAAATAGMITAGGASAAGGSPAAATAATPTPSPNGKQGPGPEPGRPGRPGRWGGHGGPGG